MICENKYFATMLAIPVNAATSCKNKAVAVIKLKSEFKPQQRIVCQDCLDSLKKYSVEAKYFGCEVDCSD